MALPRLRQVVLAARDLTAVMAELERELGVCEPFHDVGVGHFGLTNAVYTLGDTFIEVVSPVQDGTAAGRQIDRCAGDCGYMAMFEVDDVTIARERLARLGVRIVWDTTYDDIVDMHLHPKDVPGAIVALDVTTPTGSWRWGGPRWTAAVPDHGPGGVRGLVVATTDPDKSARRWAEVVGTGDPSLRDVLLDDGGQRLHFTAADGPERIVAVDVHTPGRSGAVTIAGVRFNRTEQEG